VFRDDRVIVTTTEEIPGHRIVRVLGIVYGSSVRAKSVASDIVAGLRTLFGGEVKEYLRLLEEAREQAFNRMIEQALRAGANAVVGVRMMSSEIMQGVAEIVFYGTAVVVEREL